jgi:hypothetical protein
MLGAGRASQLAGWWNQGGPATVTMSAQAALNYEVYQTPSFSWLNVPSTSTTPPGAGGAEARFALGNINAANVSGLTNYNNFNLTYVFTFAIDYPSGIDVNDGYKYDQKFQGNGGDFTGNFAWVRGYSGGNQLQINIPSAQGIELPASTYEDYNGRWLTFVASTSNNKAAFSNWTGGTSTNDYYSRVLVVDTETGEQIALSDGALSASSRNGYPTDLATWITDASGNISTDRSDSYSWSLGFASGEFPDDHLRIAGIWASFGTMFDPLTETDTSWRTTRPNAQIGNASCWFNGQFDGIGNTAGYDTAWATSNGMDRFTPATAGEQLDLIQYSGNSTVFNDRYSTTDIPKSRG